MRLVTAFVSLLAMLAPPPLQACSIVLTRHAVDESIEDDQAPVLRELRLGNLTRGRAPRSAGGNFVISSCDDIGMMRIHVRAEDRGAGAANVGWEVRVHGESAPEFFNLETPLLASEQTVTLYWSDGASDDQEPLDFSVSVRAIDGAGNSSGWSEPLHVVHPPSS